MSRDLRIRRKTIGYCAICAVGMVTDPEVFRLATAENVEAHLSQLQPGTWQALQFQRVLWTPGFAVARTIVVGVERFLTDVGNSLGNHWYRAPLELLDQLIVAQQMTLKARLWTHQELVARLRNHANEEADRFANGVF
ncbi:hypothetical protein [Mesorhizobium sp.]|uniref:hypothetical protein n=1 Tax=Mesorhizobium sp. TaxID=1871066 RepID=UPI000FE53EB6|nr:hypothetical protein [Mesorhizobium sp.]RWB67583.1 MAG: hypothetical protein EOQ49_25010 [Mesorhizobium sp.]